MHVLFIYIFCRVRNRKKNKKVGRKMNFEDFEDEGHAAEFADGAGHGAEFEDGAVHGAEFADQEYMPWVRVECSHDAPTKKKLKP